MNRIFVVFISLFTSEKSLGVRRESNDQFFVTTKLFTSRYCKYILYLMYSDLLQ